MAQKKPARNEPRELNAKAWYYANDGSVDLVTEGDRLVRTVRLKRAWLLRMLADLRPPSRVTTKAAKADPEAR